MFTFFNALSCIILYYMYNKNNNLQRKIDFLEYEMVMLTNFIYKPSAPLLKFD